MPDELPYVQRHYQQHLAEAPNDEIRGLVQQRYNDSMHGTNTYGGGLSEAWKRYRAGLNPAQMDDEVRRLINSPGAREFGTVPVLRAADLLGGNMGAVADPEFYQGKADELNRAFTAPAHLITGRGRDLDRINTHYDRAAEDLVAMAESARARQALERDMLVASLMSQQDAAFTGLGSIGAGAATGARRKTQRNVRRGIERSEGAFDMAANTELDQIQARSEALGYQRDAAVDGAIRGFEDRVRSAELAYLLGSG